MNFKLTISRKLFYFNMLLAIFLLVVITCIVVNPARYINSVFNGLVIWVSAVLPSLFPFFFLTKILMGLNVVGHFCSFFEKPMKFLFKAPAISVYVFFMSIISGYPVGAKLIADLFESGQITEDEANKLTTFCSTSGPMFIIGSVAVGMFLNVKIGFVMYISHILGSFFNGLLFRNAFYKSSNNTNSKAKIQSQQNLLNDSMNSSITSILVVGGFIAFFSMIIDIFTDLKVVDAILFVLSPITNIFKLNSSISQALLNGLIEITRGCFELSKLNLSITSLTVMGTGIITFGGFSIFFQSITFLSRSKVKIKFFLLQKMTHTALSCVISWLLCLILF